MEGYLQKKGRGKTFSFIKPWSHRFFEIDFDKNELSYHTIDEKTLSKVFKGSISLENSTVVESDSHGKEHGFEIRSGEGTNTDVLVLAADNEKTKNSWVSALRSAIDRIKQTKSEGTEDKTDSTNDEKASPNEHPYLKYGGHFNNDDAKNTSDFQYLKFDTLPRFTTEHKSAMVKHLTPELFNRLKDVKSDKGYTLSNVIMTGVVTPHLGVGATAGDEQCWEIFKDLFNPIIRDWHGYDPETQTHPVDLDYGKLQFSDEQKALFNEYVVSTRVRAARNISGYSLPAGATEQDRANVEGVLKQAFSGLSGELAGKYYELGGLTEEQTNFLLTKGFLFQVPSARNLLTGAGAARSWPDNRGIFHNDAQTALCWVNEEDHCRIISMEEGGDIPSVFARFCNLSYALEESAQANGTQLMRSEKLGFLGTCPSNLGTGLRASVMIRLPAFNRLLETGEGDEKTLLDDVCSAFDLQPRGSAGEHSAAVGAKFDVSNKQRLGYSEVQLVQKMIDGVTKVIELEKMLVAGSSPADVRAMIANTKESNHPYLKYGGHFNNDDPKNTSDFQYLKFDTLPRFTSEHKSAMAKHLTPELFNRLKDVKSDKGYTLSNVIMTGVVTPHLGVGATAGDEQCWEIFKDLFNPIIRDWHGYDPETQTHPVDLDYGKLQFSDEQKALFNEYVVSTRVRAARNISGYSLPAGATEHDRANVEGVLKQAFSGLSGELAGKYYELGGLTEEQTNFLLTKGFLFQVPSARNLLTGAGAARSWPDNRGIFHNDAQTALCWVNEEDHCRIISMEEGGDIPSVFARFCNLSYALEESAQANGTQLMRSEKLGFLGTCPSNLGTGLRASVMIRLPAFNRLLETGEGDEKTLLDDVCSAFDLQPRGSAGEHSAAVGAKFDVSNKQRLGYSEVQLVQKMIDGVTKVIELEKMLVAGSSPADVRAMIANTKESNHPYLKYGGHFNNDDPKNTSDFQYLKFDTLPRFTSEHKSAMAKHLTPELFNRLKDVKSDKGYTLSNVIMTGVVTPHLGVGATAGDEQCWEIFKDLFNPIIRDWHGYDPETQTHPVDLDYGKLQFSDEQKALFNEYVVSTRVRAARNISGYSLPAGATEHDRANVEGVLKQAFSGLSGELAGKYYELGGLTEEQTNFLLTKGFLFQVPSARNLLTGAGAARSWPDNRGIFHNDAQTALCWVNEEDHCRIISMEEGGDIPSVFARFCNLSYALEESAQANGTQLMRSEKLGFLGTCPSNLGTGLRASVMIRLPAFNRLLETGEGDEKTLLDDVCSAFDLQPRGSAGEHSAAVGAKFDVSNKQRLGYSEVQLVQKMIDGVTKVIELEKMLVAGSSPADVRAKIKDM